MRVEPVGDAAAVLDAVRRLPAPREVVIVLGEAHEDGLSAEDLQRDEELLGLFDRTAEIALGVKDQERRLHLVDVREGRAIDQLLTVTPWGGTAHLMLPEMPADVARAERGNVV